MDHKLKEMEAYASIHHIPIMERDGITFLLNYIKENSIKTILEIGTAIGYSAIQMCNVDSSITVTTIERDALRYQEAIDNIQNCGLENRITVLFQDALEVELNQKYDLIFIDAAKSQYIKFFQKFEKNLNQNGTIISDNLNFHGLTEQEESTLSRNVRGMVRKLNQYKEFIKNNHQYKTIIYPVGDGVGVSIKKD